MTICSIQLSPRFQHTKHGGLRGRVGGGEGDLNENYFMVWILASQRLRFSKLSTTSGDHCSPQRYHHLMNSQSRVIIFFLLHRPTWQMQLNYDLLSSWVREGNATVLHSRSHDAQRTLLEGTCPAATQSWSPNPPQSPGNQIAIAAVWFNPALRVSAYRNFRCPRSHQAGRAAFRAWKIRPLALTARKSNGFASPFNMHVWLH